VFGWELGSAVACVFKKDDRVLAPRFASGRPVAGTVIDRRTLKRTPPLDDKEQVLVRYDDPTPAPPQEWLDCDSVKVLEES
jgi:hypothetical protein